MSNKKTNIVNKCTCYILSPGCRL